MDTPGMKNSLWVKPPRIPVTILKEPSQGLAGHPVTKDRDARVGCVAKKGRALYHEDLVGTTPYGGACTPCHKAREPLFPTPMHVTIKNTDEQEKMRIAGRLAARSEEH